MEILGLKTHLQETGESWKELFQKLKNRRVLLTTEPVDEFEKASDVIHYYRARWTIEDSCKALKQGARLKTASLKRGSERKFS